MERGIFDGVKVADFGWVVVGALTSGYLANLGAQVVRIESTKKPDMLRVTAPYRDNIAGLNRSYYFAVYNTNKLGVTLNLSHPKSRDVVRRIIAWADVVTENFTPGTMERWGLGYEDLVKIKPDIIMVRMSMQGQTGPHARHPGVGTILAGLAGFHDLLGWPDREPASTGPPYPDFFSPAFSAVALIAALDYRRRTGKGVLIDHTQYESSMQFLAPQILDYVANGRVAERRGNRSSRAAPHGVFRCRGADRWCAIAAYTDQQWTNLCQAMGDPAWTREAKFATLLARKNHEDELERRLEEWTTQHTAHEVMELLQAAGVPAGVVRDMRDLYADPQLEHRGHFHTLHHPELGEHYCERPAFRLSKSQHMVTRPAPCMGQDNAYVYTQVLGIPEADFVELLNEGVLD